MDRGGSLRRGVSMAGHPPGPARRGDDGTRHHQFSARRVGSLEGGVEFLVIVGLKRDLFHPH